MRETSARLLRLLSLLQARPDWAGPELARRLEITPRTLRRDVQRLRDLGYPVTATPGVAGGGPRAGRGRPPPPAGGEGGAGGVAVGAGPRGPPGRARRAGARRRRPPGRGRSTRTCCPRGPGPAAAARS